MLNTCHQCGLYRADKIIEPDGPAAICPECGHRHSFRQLPLLIVSGASGAGKSTVCHRLLGRLDHVVILDSDVLWRPEFDTPDDNYRDYFEMWLRMCKGISQSGRPAVLFGAGAGVPSNIEPCVERRFFTSVKYLALVCSDVELAARLRQRPAWRGSHSPANVEEQQRFNQWFKAYGDSEPPIDLLDTTGIEEQDTADGVEKWINDQIEERRV